MSSALSSKLRTRFCEYIEEGLSGRAAAAIGANTAKARFVRIADIYVFSPEGQLCNILSFKQ